MNYAGVDLTWLFWCIRGHFGRCTVYSSINRPNIGLRGHSAQFLTMRTLRSRFRGSRI